MGWTVLYLAFGVVALWLLGEVLLQYKARLRWRLLAFGGFLGVVLGVMLPSVPVIAVGAIAFAVGQTYVTLSFRSGFATGWALGGRPGASRRRRSSRPAESPPTLEVSDLEAVTGDEPGAPYAAMGGAEPAAESVVEATLVGAAGEYPGGAPAERYPDDTSTAHDSYPQPSGVGYAETGYGGYDGYGGYSGADGYAVAGDGWSAGGGAADSDPGFGTGAPVVGGLGYDPGLPAADVGYGGVPDAGYGYGYGDGSGYDPYVGGPHGDPLAAGPTVAPGVGGYQADDGYPGYPTGYPAVSQQSYGGYDPYGHQPYGAAADPGYGHPYGGESGYSGYQDTSAGYPPTQPPYPPVGDDGGLPPGAWVPHQRDDELPPYPYQRSDSAEYDQRYRG